MTDRTFSVSLGYSVSSSAPLSCGVPQASVLGPLGISFHCYVDDSQIYVPLKKKDEHSARWLLTCLDDIKAWMALSFLNFNDEKTEVMVFVGTTGTPL